MYIICMVEFTKHALERLAERGASREFVEKMANGETKAVSFPSPKDASVRIITAMDGKGKYWTAICSANKIITVHRAHKQEEKRYDENSR